jgi:putative methyltransferase (TIGR04325 family)
MIKKALQQCLPPVLYWPLRNWVMQSKEGRFTGPFDSWESALSNSSGYAQQAILDKAYQATLKVCQGQAVAERDTLLLENYSHSYPLLAMLMKIALQGQGQLRVLDIGGALGTSYLQFKAWQPEISHLTWSVVEQPHFVACGNQHFKNHELQFFEDLALAIEHTSPQVVLLSAFLHYVEAPFAFLKTLLKYKVPYLIFDRTPMLATQQSLLAVQHVPPQIYSASYPSWLFSEEQLKAALAAHYHVIAEFPALDGQAKALGQAIQFKGMLLELKDNHR